MESETKAPPLATFAVVELMGHIKLAGKVSEETHFGCVVGRIDVPLEGDKWQTMFFGGSAVFRITPCDEATARAVAVHCATAPISRYELPKLIDAPVKATAAGCCAGCGNAREDCDCDEDDDRPKLPF